jgi:hypothetical protein
LATLVELGRQPVEFPLAIGEHALPLERTPETGIDVVHGTFTFDQLLLGGTNLRGALVQSHLSRVQLVGTGRELLGQLIQTRAPLVQLRRASADRLVEPPLPVSERRPCIADVVTPFGHT